MSKSFVIAAAAALAALGVFVNPSFAQRAGALPKRAAFAPAQAGTKPFQLPQQNYSRHNILVAPRNQSLPAPKLPNAWQPQPPLPAAFGQRPVAPVAQFGGKAIPPNYHPQRTSPVLRTTPTRSAASRIADQRQRPIAPENQPAGNPWIASSRARQLDPALRNRDLSANRATLPNRFPERASTPTGPVGNAAPAVGARGLAADEPLSPAEQDSTWRRNLGRALEPDQGNYYLNPQAESISRIENDGGISRLFWNSRGELMAEGHRFPTAGRQETVQIHNFATGQTETKQVEGPYDPWARGRNPEIRNTGWQIGERKGPPQQGTLQGTFNGQPIASGGNSSGGQGGPKQGDKNPKPAPQPSQPKPDKPSGDPSEKPVKDPDATGGPKKQSSSPGAEGTDGLGVAGGGQRLPTRSETNFVPRSSQPDSVAQPAPDDNSRFTGGNRPRITAPEFNPGGYLPTTVIPLRGPGLASQPTRDDNIYSNAAQPLPLELLRDSVTNPIPTP